MLMLASLGLGGGLALIVFTVLAQAQEKAVVRSTLRQLDDYEVENMRDRELLTPLKERAIAPIRTRLTGLARRFTPVGYADNARRKIVLAGAQDANAAVDRFLATRVMTIVAIPVVFVLIVAFSPLQGRMAFAAFALIALFLVLGPDAILNRKIAE